jgi:hypothetical protein
LAGVYTTVVGGRAIDVGRPIVAGALIAVGFFAVMIGVVIWRRA